MDSHGHIFLLAAGAAQKYCIFYILRANESIDIFNKNI